MENIELERIRIEKELFEKRRSEVRNLLSLSKEEIKKVLPPFLDADKVIRIVLTVFNDNPNLYKCTNLSIIGSVLKIAELGLLPINTIGEIFLIPVFNDLKKMWECQFMIGYKGLCALAYRSGQVLKIHAKEVYEGDFFSYEYGTDNEHIKHVPALNNSNNITHFYAIVKMKNGGTFFNVMSKEEIENIRNDSTNYKFSKNKNETIWSKNFAEMGNKTVLRRLFKFVPISTQLHGLALDEQAEYKLQNFNSELLELNLSEEINQELITEIVKSKDSDKSSDLKKNRINNAEAVKKIEQNTVKKIISKKNN